MRLSSLIALSCSPLVLLGANTEVRAQECAPARAMVVLDKSSSMQTGKIGAVSKWSVAVDALDTVVAEFEDEIELGLMTFPRPDECAAGTVDVAPVLGARAAIMSELSAPPPSAGNWTPMAQTLEAAAAAPSLTSSPGPAYVVLITDGWQWCSPYDPSTRFTPVDAIGSLSAAGITTYVVGFGDSVDSLTLNTMAVEAGTARQGCDPTGDAPDAANPCYFQADNPAQLVAALMEIGVEVSSDVCCELNEGETRPCQSDCGSGLETCTSGEWTACDAPAPDTCAPAGCDEIEMCDGIDNDCDRAIDEASDDVGGLCEPGFQCVDGGCEPVDPVIPPGDDPPADAPLDEGDVSAGCACRAGAGGGPVGAGALVLAGLVAARRRRTRHVR